MRSLGAGLAALRYVSGGMQGLEWRRDFKAKFRLQTYEMGWPDDALTPYHQ